jgi:hypothetical protein
MLSSESLTISITFSRGLQISLLRALSALLNYEACSLYLIKFFRVSSYCVGMVTVAFVYLGEVLFLLSNLMMLSRIGLRGKSLPLPSLRS